MTSTMNFNGETTQECSFNSLGIKITSKVSNTLQGCIYKGQIISSNETIIIKRANIALIQNKIALTNNNKIIKINEDIIKEIKLMSYIEKISTLTTDINGILKIYKYFCDNQNIYIIMEYGGNQLWEHIKKYHDLILKNKMKLNIWLNHIKIIFKQMCNIIAFLHNKCHVCHLDISLENFTIKGFKIDNEYKIINHGQVYICDFGLAEVFANSFCINKYCGKAQYQAPEMAAKLDWIDARKCDIWSLGVCGFMMQIGVAPLNSAQISDPFYCNIISGHLYTMIKNNNKSKYCDEHFISLMNSMLTPQNNRYDISQILKHKYFI